MTGAGRPRAGGERNGNYKHGLWTLEEVQARATARARMRGIRAYLKGAVSDLKSAAATIGVEIDVVRAADSREIEGAFTALARDKVHALVVGTDPFFFSQRVQLVTLAMRHALPTVYNVREYAEAGGLMSYGTSLTEALRQMGAYTARILKGEKPFDLPVVQSTKFDFVINLPTARTLGLAIPPMLLARADEVIE